MVAYISVYSKPKLIPFMGASLQQSTWIDLSDVRKHGAIFAFRNMGGTYTLPSSVKQNFPSLKYLGNYFFENKYPFSKGGKRKYGVHIAFFILCPQ